MFGAHDDDAALLVRLSAGDSGAFWPLWEHHNRRLRLLCHRILRGHADDVEDVLSEVMIRAFSRLAANPDGLLNPEAWLTQIAYRCCVKWLKTHARSAKYVEVMDDLDNVVTAWTGTNLETMLLRRELHDHLFTLVEELPDRLRDPFILYIFHGMTYDEIATQLKITPENARKRVQHARMAIREGLQQGLHEAVQPAATPLVIAEPQRSMVTHLSRIEGQIERLLQDTAHEVSWRVVETRDVQVALPSGTAIGYHLLLDHKTPRRVVRLETLRLHVTKYPRGWRKRLELADLLYAMGRWTEAVQEYRDVLARNPRQLDIWLRVGQILRLLEQTEEAVAVYRSARDVVSRESTRAYIDGLCAQCEERWLDAMAAFEKAISQEPDNPAHRHALASLYLQVHRVADALAIYDALLAQNPDDMVALVNSWGPLHDLGRWEDMERRLRRALELNPDDILALGALGSLRVEQGLLTGSEGKETEKLLQRAVRIAPEAADALFRLATLYLRRGEASRALVMARTFLEAHLQSSHAWYYYAMLLAMQSEHDEAADAMLYAYALSPTNQYICGRTCVCLQEAQRLEELRRVAEEVVARFPQNWHLLMTAAQAYVDVLQDPATGMRLSERAIAIQPEFPVCWLYHAKLLMAQRHFDKAIAALHEGWAHVTPQCASAVATEMAFTLGLCYRDMEDHTLAREWFQRARECALEMKASSKVSWLHKAQQALDTDPASGG